MRWVMNERLVSLLPFVCPLFGAAALSWFLSWNAWRRRHIPGGADLFLMLLAVGLWCLLYALEAALPHLTAKTVIAGTEYLGIVSVPVLWLTFSLRYTGLNEWLAGRRIALFFIEPALTLALLATNPLHHLVWTSVSLNASGPLGPLFIQHGPFFWVHLIYSYALILAGAVILVRAVIRYPKDYRTQAVPIVIAVAAPLIANVLYAAGIPGRDLDLTPFAFAVTGAALALAMSRYRLLDLFLGLRLRARIAILETMPDGVIVLDQQDRIVDFNPAASALFADSSLELLGAGIDEVMKQCALTSEQEGLENGNREIHLGEDSTGRSFDMLTSPLGGTGRKGEGRLVVFREITQRRRAERAALESERQYRALVDNAHDLIFTLDEVGRFVRVNAAVERVTGYGEGELLAWTLSDIAGKGGLLDLTVGQSPLLDSAGERHEVRLTTKSGGRLVLEANVRGVFLDGTLSGYECIARDVTESREWEEALRFQALHDSVTGLSNRMRLRERIEELLIPRQGTMDPFALYILDLDEFKNINDNLGHQCGDTVLEVVAARLEKLARSADILARLGGDEFALVVPLKDAGDASRIAHRILEVFKNPFKVDGRELSLSASIGVALFPEHGSTVDTLLRFADIAMYAAKRAGGARHAIYELDGDHHSPDRFALRADLHEAFEHGHLTLYYQPLLDLRRHEVHSLEALVRWNHPRRGLILPAQFLDLLEQDGQADRLTNWALEKAIGQCARWRARGLKARVSVNLSARNLDDPDLPDLIAGLLREHQADSRWLTVELTESSVMLDPVGSVEVLTAIRELGVSVAIDDFGAGQSALPYLKKIPADQVKIDKSFILGMTLDKQDAAIVRSTIGLAHELGLTVVGEGVENEATMRLLRAYGCDFGQGYYLGRPARPSSIPNRLQPGATRLLESSRIR